MNGHYCSSGAKAATILFATALIAMTAAMVPPPAASDPRGPCLNVSGTVVCVEDPPGMNYSAALGQKCNNASGRYIFGRGADGQTLVCAGYPSSWNRGPMVFGVQYPGGACPFDGQSLMGRAAAQTPDGRPLICGEQGWVIN